MRLKLYSPRNPVLKKYIECIYILTRTSEEKATKYLTFPSIYTIATISEKSRTVEKGDKLIIKHCAHNKIETNLVFNFNKPVYVQYEGKINEITIYFKPLGINSFFDYELSHYNKSNFSDFSPFDDYKNAMIDILSLHSDSEKIRAIENYWLSKLKVKGFQYDFLENIVAEMMSKNKTTLTIAGLSKKNAISRATLNKHFDRHLCKTPSQFKKILRFRNAINRYLTTSKSKSKLTNIVYSLDYFDQSHMVKDFKSLTGYSPKDFFIKTTDLEKKQISWLFL